MTKASNEQQSIEAFLLAAEASIGVGMFNRITAKVTEMMTAWWLPGQEKMQFVIESAQQEDINLSTTLIRAIVEVYLLKQQAA